MKTLMSAWSEFCDTLNTRGGTIALLFLSTMFLGFAILHAEHMGWNGTVEAVLTTTFSSFTGALLLALTQKDKTDKVNGDGGQK